MKRLALCIFLLAALAPAALGQIGRTNYTFSVETDAGMKPGSFDVVIYSSGGTDVTATCYTTATGTTGFTSTNITDGDFVFWSAESTVTVQLTTDGTSGVRVLYYGLTSTDHRLILPRTGVIAPLVGIDGSGIDVTWYGDTAGDYMKWDQDAQTNGVLLFEDTGVCLNDDTRIRFGDGATAGAGDLYFASSAANLLTLGQVVSGTGTLAIGVDGKGVDSTFYGETASSQMLWDQDGATNGLLVFTACGATFADSSVLRFGTGAANAGDLTLTYTGGTNILNLAQTVAGTGELTIGADDKGIDITLFSETASDFIMWDQDSQTNGQLIFEGAAAIFRDSSRLRFGTGASADAGDVYFDYDGGTNRLQLTRVNASTQFVVGSTAAPIPVTISAASSGSSMAWSPTDNTNAGSLTFNNASVDWYDADNGNAYSSQTVNNELTLTASDAADAKFLIGATGGTNGLDVTFNSITSGDNVAFDAGAKTWVFTDVTPSTNQGVVFENATPNAFELTLSTDTITQDATVKLPDLPTASQTGSSPVVVKQGYTTLVTHSEATTVDVTGSDITLPAGWFVEGKTIHVKAGGIVTGAAGTASVLLYLEDAAVMTLTTTDGAAGDWVAEFTIVATGTATQRIIGTLTAEGGVEHKADYATAAKDTATAGTMPIKLQVGLANAADTITCEYFTYTVWNLAD